MNCEYLIPISLNLKPKKNFLTLYTDSEVPFTVKNKVYYFKIQIPFLILKTFELVVLKLSKGCLTTTTIT